METNDRQYVVPMDHSKIAKDGNTAERLLCTSRRAQDALSEYLQTNITIERIPGHTKSDVRFKFEGGSVTAQIKSGTGGGRGWSFDRRKIDNVPGDAIRSLLNAVCLNNGTPDVVEGDSSLIQHLLLGDSPETAPELFIHLDVNDGEIVHMSVCRASEMIAALVAEAYPILKVPRTCVHLSPRIYLQRKGAKKDSRPNDIQAKLKGYPNIMTVLF